MLARFVLYARLLFLTLTLCATVVCQDDLSLIRGKLTQLSGSPLHPARVVAISISNGKRYSAFTDLSGEYLIDHLPADTYKMRFEGAGFKPYSEEFVPTVGGMPTEVNVRLADIESEQVSGSASAEPSILKIDRADVSTTFTRQEIENLPIYNQNLSRLESLVPGALQSRDTLDPFQNPQQSTFVNLNGQRFSGTGFSLDGAINRDPLEGLVVVIPSVESAAGMRVTTQNYSAEYGEATAGFVSVQTLSGTNRWHGMVYGYRQTGFGQASQPDFGQSSSFLIDPSQRRLDFGGSAGGALIRDRLFLFGDYRGIRQSNNGTVLLTVPSATVHNTCTGNPTDPSCDISEYTRAGAFCSPPLCVNGMIPNSNVSPQMVKFLQMIPLPNYEPGGALTNNFIAHGVESLNSDNFDVRADFVASSKLRTFGRYITDRFRQDGSPAFGPVVGGIGTNPAGFAGSGRPKNESISAGFSYALTPSMLADFRFGLIRYNVGFSSPDAGTTPALNAGVVGLNLGNSYTSGMPDIQLDNPNASGLPIAGNLDFLRLGYSPSVNRCNCPFTEREQQFQWLTNWTKTSGSHVFKWGADIRYLQNFRLSSDRRPAGHLEFANNITGFSLGDFLIGGVSFFDRSYNNPQNPAALNAGERQKRMFFYGEDTWRLGSQLTINYGLRWEIYLPQSVTGSDAGGWLQLGSGATPFQDQFLVAGESGTNLQGGVKTTLKNFGPRLGVAYLLNPTTVIRAGYGRAFDSGYGGTIFGIAATQSPPVAIIDTIQKGFFLNSNIDPTTATPVVDVCVQNGTCTVPPFMFPSGSFTISDLYTQNLIPNPNPKQLPETQQANLYALPRRLRLPTVDAWNLAIQEQLNRNTYLEISYIANKGTHVLNDSSAFFQVPYYNLNQPTLVGFIAPVKQVGIGNCQGSPKILQNVTYCKTLQSLRQAFTPWTSEVRYFGNDASSTYQSVQVKVRRQFSSGFSLLAHYTWSKVIDFDNLYYAIDPRISRGIGNFDRKHNFVMTNIWDLPVGRGKTLWGGVGPVLNRVVGGWSLAAITSWSSGLPFTPTYSGCGVDVGFDNYRACRPNLVGPVHVTRSRSQYFTTTGGQRLQASCVVNGSGDCPYTTPSFLQGFDPTTGEILVGQTIGPWQRPGAGQIGNAGRNSFRGPGFFQTDLAVSKNIAITERVSLRFRMDAFNVFNKVNLANPVPAVDSVIGGQIFSLTPGAIQRQLQFSLHIGF